MSEFKEKLEERALHSPAVKVAQGKPGEKGACLGSRGDSAAGTATNGL